jgi:hypothetical protein
MVTVATATAVASGPAWNVTQVNTPTNLAPGSTGVYGIQVTNLSREPSAGEIRVKVDLPDGLTAYIPSPPDSPIAAGDNYFWVCPDAESSSSFTCIYGEALVGPVPPYETVKSLTINVRASSDAGGVKEGRLTVSGGGAETDAETVTRTTFSDVAAEFGIDRFAGGAYGADGRAARQAGGHPNLATEILFSTRTNANGVPGPSMNVNETYVDLPAGLIANPRAVPVCPTRLLEAGQGRSLCPPDTAVGYAQIFITADRTAAVPVYNTEPAIGFPARLAFNFYDGIINIEPTVRAGTDYGVTARVSRANQSVPVPGFRLALWALPADPAHDAQRGGPGPTARVPFTTAPTACTGQPLKTTLTAFPWGDASMVRSASFDRDFLDGSVITTEGCDKVGFTPSVEASPTSSVADSPSGLDVTLTSPQDLENPDGFAKAHLRDVDVTLPEGVSVNPGSADGLQACSDEQLGLGNDRSPSCPDGAKIGEITATTPLLEKSLSGRAYLRTQASDDPESGDMFRMAIVVEDKLRGILVKLPGSIRINRETGQIKASFKDNPQLPVSEISLKLKSGSRAPLATPAACGARSIAVGLSSWAGHRVDQSLGFAVDCPGAQGFAPALTAGSTNPLAGSHTEFVFRAERPDRQEVVNGVQAVLSTGLLAKLKGVPQCTSAQAEAGNCAAASRVGTATVGAGPGSNPYYLTGQPVYLGGPYKGAPFSLAVIARAAAGPFDLGTVIVRQALRIDPISAQVTVDSDPLPTIVKGVPLRLRSVEVKVDRPGFMLNPTSCEAKTITATFSAPSGATAGASNRFQASDCASLDLKPSLALSLSGKGQTTDGKHPAITASLTQKPGQANLKKVRVALPLSLALDPDNANGLCEFVDGSKATPTCPKSSIVGSVTATTPILDEPLTGPVYFVKNVRKDPKSGREIRTLPKLVIPLTGQNGVKLTLTGTSDVEDEQLVTTFDNIPDAPVSSFKLSIIGGKGGILTVSGADICKSTQIASQQVDGQNNKAADTDIAIQTPSCPLKVLSKKTTKRSVAVKVGGLGAGKVTITGKGIKKTSKTITKSTVATITAKRTKGKPGKIKVSYDPTGAAKARKTSE